MPFFHRCLLSCCLALAVPSSLLAQSERDAPSQLENVRLDYAQVLNVEPVYETLRATRAEVVCEEAPKPAARTAQPEEGRLTRAWSSVKEFFGSEERKQVRQVADAAQAGPRCRSVPSSREFQRPIAYDVDYIYKGMKYRSRLPDDPGSRLRIRISVMPYQAGVAAPASGP
ncbi:MAG: hypothetical protein QM769_11835 [Pseudoxanthomonas sp.]